MNVTDTVPPPYTTPSPIGNPPGNHDYLFVVGFFGTALLLVTITYASCSCFKDSPSPSPPPHDTHYDYDNIFSQGLDDDIIITFPTFVYSETTKRDHKFDTTNDDKGSNCSICLEDYKAADVVRLFPECGHLFHVRCIDTWLKAHVTCPMCRNFAGINLTELT